LKKRKLVEEESVKLARQEFDRVNQQRKNTLILEKAKTAPLTSSNQRKGFFQASRRHEGSRVGAAGLGLLTGISYINAVQTFKKTRKGTFGELFRSESALALVASVISLLVVLVL